MNYSEIIKSLQDKKFHSIYFLTGEEIFFIDKISKYIENNTLNESEKEFNQKILYGKETTIENIILEAKLFPSFGEKRVVIVKEAAVSIPKQAPGVFNLSEVYDYVKQGEWSF